MQMNLSFAGTNSSAAVLEMPRKAVKRRAVQSFAREPSILLIDRPTPAGTTTPRQPAPVTDPSQSEEDPERWDGLY